jgi:hypothetical protein
LRPCFCFRYTCAIDVSTRRSIFEVTTIPLVTSWTK